MNDGFVNEKVLREYINNGKFFNAYNNNIKAFLAFVFGQNLNANSPFKAERIAGQAKPDLMIKHNNVEKYISVKKGSGNSVHQEPIDLFFPYIDSLLGLETLNNLKTFHYGDDTINDTGAIRYSAKQCQSRYAQKVSALNTEFNKQDNLVEFLDRFLFVGNAETTAVDVVYHGGIDLGLWATKEEITSYIQAQNVSKKAVHFGPLTYQAWGRNEKRTAKYPDRRYVMQIKWGSLAEDLKNIRSGDQ